MYDRQTAPKPEIEKIYGIEIEKLHAFRRLLISWNSDQTNLLSTREKEVPLVEASRFDPVYGSVSLPTWKKILLHTFICKM